MSCRMKRKKCVVIDASSYYTDEREMLLNYIMDHDFVIKHLLNTHLHFDHRFWYQYTGLHV